MYSAKVKTDFSGAHNLRGYKGKCEDLHGHNWTVEVTAQRPEPDNLGMVVDFKDLKSLLWGAIAEMDHAYLNDLEYFKDVNPTSENIARYIYEKLNAQKPDLDIVKVTIWETASSCASYSPAEGAI